mgnify:CR=1 FL=1
MEKEHFEPPRAAWGIKMEITDETIAHVAELVKLEFDGERAAGIKADLFAALELFFTLIPSHFPFYVNILL